MIRKKSTSQTHYEANSKLNYYKPLSSTINMNLTSKEKKYNRYSKEENVSSKDSFAKNGTWSDRIGVFVNIVMVFFTLALFRQAVRQNTTAEKTLLWLIAFLNFLKNNLTVA